MCVFIYGILALTLQCKASVSKLCAAVEYAINSAELH